MFNSEDLMIIKTLRNYMRNIWVNLILIKLMSFYIPLIEMNLKVLIKTFKSIKKTSHLRGLFLLNKSNYLTALITSFVISCPPYKK